MNLQSGDNRVRFGGQEGKGIDVAGLAVFTDGVALRP